KAMLKNTDPFELSRHIDQQLEGLYKLAAQRNGAAREKAPLRELRPNVDAHEHKPHSVAQTPRSPWKDWTFSKKLKRRQYEIQRPGTPCRTGSGQCRRSLSEDATPLRCTARYRNRVCACRPKIDRRFRAGVMALQNGPADKEWRRRRD